MGEKGERKKKGKEKKKGGKEMEGGEVQIGREIQDLTPSCRARGDEIKPPSSARWYDKHRKWQQPSRVFLPILPSSLPFHSLFLSLSLSLSARLPWALRVNHVRQADPLIKTGPPSLLIIIVIRGSECRALGESRLDRRLLRVYVPRIDTTFYIYICIYVFAIPLCTFS